MAGFSCILGVENLNQSSLALPMVNSVNSSSPSLVTHTLCQVAKFCHFAMTFSVDLTFGLTDFVNLVDANASLKEFFSRSSKILSC